MPKIFDNIENQLFEGLGYTLDASHKMLVQEFKDQLTIGMPTEADVPLMISTSRINLFAQFH